MLDEVDAPLVKSLAGQLEDLSDVRDDIGGTLIDEPPAFARDGGMIRDGVDAELDELRTISRSGKQVIAAMEERERQRTGVASLKIRFNRVFGYYIEVTKSNLHAVPDDYQRKQTIAGGERYITPALKEYEEKVLGADERILTREVELFEALRARVAAASARIQDTARALAALDVLSGLAEQAAHGNYIKPHVHDGDDLIVTDGRHPVVERHARDAFVPNDIVLDGSTHQLVVLTGPNMGGKSTYLRQTALICLLAQAGSFVPARTAKLSIVDRIFARVGASDNIARGQSTFMVEMQETASILHLATSRSLVVLDEIGRGTATFDGLSIAWAVAEYLVSNTRARPKTLFATHYHELTDLADAWPGVVNFHVAVREWHDDIVFLRKIMPGRSDRSYGIHVARLAGLPAPVVARAREILTALEQDELARGGRPSITQDAERAGRTAAAGTVPTVLAGRSRGGTAAIGGHRSADPTRRADVAGGSEEGPRGRVLMSVARILFVLLFVISLTASPARANRYDPRLRFRSLTTTHFVIHYHQGEEALALRLAVIAEDEYQRLVLRLGHTPRNRTHVVLADQDDEPNGLTTVLPYNLIEITASPPDGESFIGNTDDWLRMVFRHEYTHVLNLDPARSWAHVARAVFGRAFFAFPNLTLPEWQIEGLAVFEESADGQGRLSAGDFREVVASGARAGPLRAHESRQWRTRGVAVGNGVVRVRRLLPRVPGPPVWRG